MKSNPDKKKKRKNLIYNILIIFFAVVAVVCAAYIGIYCYSNYKSENRYEDLRQTIVEDSEALDDSGNPIYVDIDDLRLMKKYMNLYNQNNDFIGWLTIPDTNIDYPVMYTPDDEEYYLHRDFDGNYSAAGALFVDGSATPIGDNISDNTIIYGHHMKYGSMFHDLLKYEDEEFYQNHKYITFDTIEELGTYEVIGAFRTQIYDEDDTEHYHYYEFFNAADEEEFDDYIEFVKNNTPYTTDSTAAYGDKLITLSTCAYHTTNGRYVVVAKKIN
jgi:sortase B